LGRFSRRFLKESSHWLVFFLVSQRIISLNNFASRFLKESPHWLVSKGKHREAVDLFHHISSVNNKVIPDSLLNQLHENEEKRTTERFMTIFRASTLLKRFAVFLYLWYVQLTLKGL